MNTNTNCSREGLPKSVIPLPHMYYQNYQLYRFISAFLSWYQIRAAFAAFFKTELSQSNQTQTKGNIYKGKFTTNGKFGIFHDTSSKQKGSSLISYETKRLW